MWKTGLCFRVQQMQARATAICGDDACMLALQLAWICNAAGMGEYAHIVHHVFHIVLHAHGFIQRHESALQTLLVRGDPRRTGVHG